MDWSGPDFIIVIILISTAGWLISSWIRARHGYPLENEWSGMTEKVDAEAKRRIASLHDENEGLKSKVDRLEQRLAVLERIATDPAERTAREIEQLR